MTVPLSEVVDNDVPGWLLERSMETTPALTWVAIDGTVSTWNYAELVDHVLRRAAGLQGRGVERGDVIALVMDNSAEMVISWLAVIAAGASAVCVNTRSAAAELSWILNHSGAIGCIADDNHLAEIYNSSPHLSWLVPTSALASLDDGARDWMRPPIESHALASVLYTSGSTSRPKGVRWTHANCLWAARVNAGHQELTSSDRYLITLPLFHTNALAYQLLASTQVGAHVILTPRFSASRFWQWATTFECTWTGVVHFIVRALRSQPVPAAHSFRGWAGSGVVHADDSLAKVPITGWYGMTETISHPLYSRVDEIESMPAGSIGRAAPEYQVRVNPDSGELLVHGVRGISLFDGYLHDEEATKSSLSTDGWFRTGDRVSIDEQDNFFFTERLGDVFKVGAENVSAAEIEAALLRTPGVREVCVVAAPDPMLTSVPVAFVIPEADVNELELESRLQESARTSLADFKKPREYRFVTEFPRSTLNKIAKGRLREQLQESRS